jgi:hypothetical protein
MYQHGQSWTVILHPGKQRVDSSILSQTTRLTSRNALTMTRLLTQADDLSDAHQDSEAVWPSGAAAPPIPSNARTLRHLDCVRSTCDTSGPDHPRALAHGAYRPGDRRPGESRLRRSRCAATDHGHHATGAAAR